MITKPKNNMHSSETSDVEEVKLKAESSSNWSERSSRREDKFQHSLFRLRVAAGITLHVLIILFFAVTLLLLFAATLLLLFALVWGWITGGDGWLAKDQVEFAYDLFKFAFIALLVTAVVLVSRPLDKLREIISFFRS